MLNLMMSKNNQTNNLSNSFYSESNSLYNVSNNSASSPQQPITVDKSIWDMYQLLMQNASTTQTTNNNAMSNDTACCQQNESSSTLDQLLLETSSKQNSSGSPILLVINSHNTSLNQHHSNPPPMINFVNTCTVPPMNTNSNTSNPSTSHQQHFNMASDKNMQIFNFQQESIKNNDSSPPLSKSNMRGIQKSHKMNKLTTQHVSSLYSSPTNSGEMNSPSASSNTPTTPTVKNEIGKFSRPLLKNETVLCERNPKFKQNYFVFEKKKEKTPISFHNISVNEIISGEIQQSGSLNTNSPKHASSSSAQKKKKAQQNSNNIIGNTNQQIIGSNPQQHAFFQYPIQVFQQNVVNSNNQSSLDSSSVSNQSSPNLIFMQNQQQKPNIRIMTTHSPNSNNNTHPTTTTTTDQRLLSQQSQQTQQQQLEVSNVLNILLSSNQGVQQQQQHLNNAHSSIPNSFYDHTTTNRTSMNGSNIEMEETSSVMVDNLLSNFSPVVEGPFPQQQSFEASSSFLDEFIIQEDLSTLCDQFSSNAGNNQSDLNNLLQELNEDQWTDLLEEYAIIMINNNNKQ